MVTARAGGRTLADIVTSNVLTRFNGLLGSLLIVILVVGPIQDAFFGLALAANIVIGVAQEVRAKLTLDRLAIAGAPTARVVRNGSTLAVDPGDVKTGELLVVEAGDEVPADGLVESEAGLEVNEALISGESEPLTKQPGQEVLAGSFVTAGTGRFRSTRVGNDNYVGRLTENARRFQIRPSELMVGIDRILQLVTWIIVPLSILLVVSQLRVSPSIPDAIRGSVAGMITLVPEGLVLLTSASLALATIRLGRRHVLVQQLQAVEMLARADVLCLDKTGTITGSTFSLQGVMAFESGPDWESALGALAGAEPNPNAAAVAIKSRYPAPVDWVAESQVPFSSTRKWSAAEFKGRGWWVLGAPDVLIGAQDEYRSIATQACELARDGVRVLVLGRASGVSAKLGANCLRPAALVLLGESIRTDAAPTIAYLKTQGVVVKVISGDHPATVEAIAKRVGLETGTTLDGRGLPQPGGELNRLAEAANIFGRVSPHQKEQIIAALRANGHTVAMVGDGVNDVLALKEADVGIAMGSGSGAARAVAAVVLLDDSFGAVPDVLQEGRRVIGNVEHLASLFFTKTVYALLLAIAVGVASLPFPFLPRQLTLISAFTIGIPAIFLTLAPGFKRSQGGFLGRVLRFAIPSGVVAALATLAAYILAIAEPDVTLSEERTVATLVMGSIGLWVLHRLAPPVTRARRLLLAAMASGLVVATLLPFTRQLFALDLPRPIVAVSALGVIAVAILGLEVSERMVRSVRRIDPSPNRFDC